jgi:hypothetical protein
LKNYDRILSKAIGHLRASLNQAEGNHAGDSLDEAELAVKDLKKFCDWRNDK